MLIETKSPFLISTYNLSQIKNNEWNNINKSKNSYYIGDNNIKLLRYPGFLFKNKNDVKLYEECYKEYKNDFTPPRGNLKNTKYIFCGIKPGHYYANLSKSESCWLFGPSTKILLRLLYECNQYPYFTNIYKSHYCEMNKNLTSIIKEIEIVNKIINKPKIIFLGNYEEYYRLSKKIENECFRIYHPAYIARKYTEENFLNWKNQFIDLGIKL